MYGQEIIFPGSDGKSVVIEPSCSRFNLEINGIEYAGLPHDVQWMIIVEVLNELGNPDVWIESSFGIEAFHIQRNLRAIHYCGTITLFRRLGDRCIQDYRN